MAADEQLLRLIERIERLEAEKKGVADDIKDVYLEAKATGYDSNAMRQIVRLRKMPACDRQEMEAILQTYMAALGMDGGPGRSRDMFVGHDGRPDPATPAPAPSASEAELFTAALHLVVDNQKASTSWLQRQLRIGYNQAARLIEQLEVRGVVGKPNHVGKRDVLVPPHGEAHPALALMYASTVPPPSSAVPNRKIQKIAKGLVDNLRASGTSMTITVAGHEPVTIGSRGTT